MLLKVNVKRETSQELIAMKKRIAKSKYVMLFLTSSTYLKLSYVQHLTFSRVMVKLPKKGYDIN